MTNSQRKTRHRLVRNILLLLCSVVAFVPCPAMAETSTNIIAVAWSPDGSEIAAGGTNGFFEVQDAATGKVLLNFPGLTGTVVAIAWSPDGQRIASGSSDQIIRVWNAASGQLLATFQGHQYAIGSLAWQPSGGLLASATDDEFTSLRMWDVQNYLPQAVHSLDAGNVYMVTWSPDSRRVAFATAAGVYILDADLNTSQGDFPSHRFGPLDLMGSVAWSPDGSRLAVGQKDGTVSIWNVSTHQPVNSFHLHSDFVFGLAWSPDGNKLASSSSDGTVKIWEPTTGTVFANLAGSTELWLASLTWNPDSAQIAYGGVGAVHVFWIQPTVKNLRVELAACVSDHRLASLLGGDIDTSRWKAFINDVQAQSSNVLTMTCVERLIQVATYLLSHP